MDLIALPLLSFFDDLSLIILVLVSFYMYKYFKGWAPSATLAMIITLVVVVLLLVPYVWFRYLMFIIIVIGPHLGGGDKGGGH